MISDPLLYAVFIFFYDHFDCKSVTSNSLKQMEDYSFMSFKKSKSQFRIWLLNQDRPHTEDIPTTIWGQFHRAA